MRRAEFLLLLILATTLCHCSHVKLGQPPLHVQCGDQELSDSLSKFVDLRQVPVFIFSHRNLQEDARTADTFGRDRSRLPSPHLAIAKVRIGDFKDSNTLLQASLTDRKPRPRLELGELDVFEAKIESQSWVDYANTWLQTIETEFQSTGSRDLTIFVHGFNTEFDQNIERAAELFHMNGRCGAIISFSWPSVGKLGGYLEDKSHAQFSISRLRELLTRLAEVTNPDTVNIIAHSAGCPIVVNALREIRLIEDELSSSEIHSKYKIGKVILAAPDMDLMSFVSGVKDGFHETTTGVAVYTCSEDRALKYAYRFKGGFRRLGRSLDWLEEWEKSLLKSIPTIEMVDVTNSEKHRHDIIGHRYFFDNSWVETESHFFIKGYRPDQRLLVKKPQDLFWKFPNDYPDQVKQLLQ